MNRRLTIGFLDEDAYDEYHNLIARGMHMSALTRYQHYQVRVFYR